MQRPMQRSTPPIAPIDPDVSTLGSLHRLAGQLVSVGGRLVQQDAPRRVVLADAFHRCRVTLAQDLPADIGLGQWLVVRGYANHANDAEVLGLQDAQLVNVTHGNLHDAGQFSRFADGVGDNLRRRAAVVSSVRKFFDRRDFYEVTTPQRVSAPGTDVYLSPQPAGPQWLITSPEFHLKRLVAGGLPRVYELAHCHRQDEAGLWHQPEFVMLEWYQAFLPFNGMMTQTEALIRHVVAELELPRSLSVGGRSVDLEKPFERITVRQAFRQFAGIDDAATLAATDEDAYFQVFVDLVEPGIAERKAPVFLTHYPMTQAALAQASPDNVGYAERCELFIGGVELCNGYGELTAEPLQRARFASDVQRRKARGLPELPYDDGLLAALSEGLPPCSGNALGLDRLVAILLGEPMERVIAFPGNVVP